MRMSFLVVGFGRSLDFLKECCVNDLSGVATDLFSYAVIIPVIPFRLEALGYNDASARTGWLLFAYSGGLAVSTPPIACVPVTFSPLQTDMTTCPHSWFSERYNARRIPLLLGLFTLIGAQVLFMLAPFYWLMALARIIQGVSSTFVWTVGLALLCDTTPEARVGQQLGLAMAGLSAGVVLAPPIGGALYQRLGFNAPFIFSIGIVLFDLAGRLLVIERKHALQWDVDPAEMITTHAADSDQTRTVRGDDSDATDKNSMLPPTPTEDSLRVDPLTLAGLNGKLVVIDGQRDDIVFGKFPVASDHTSSSDKTATPEAIAATPKDLEDNTPSLAKGSPVVFFDTKGELTVVEPKVSTSWNSHDHSLKGRLTDLRVDTPQAQPAQVLQDAGMEKGDRNPVPQVRPNQNAVASGRELEETSQLTSMQVLSAMCRSRRALAAFTNTLLYG